MDTKHTPGPWEVVGTEVRSAKEKILVAGGFYTGTHRRGQTEANVRLIAAAPDLLAFTQAVIAHQNCIFDAPSSDFCERCKALVAQGQAALAKAEGR